MQNEHRKIGKLLNLFDLSEHASGMVCWLPQGYELYQKIENYLRQMQQVYGYVEVKSPIMANSDLWAQSGHLAKYQQNMYLLESGNDTQLAIKPMNCPFHIKMFNQMCQSYRQLPLRLAEFGLCHRNEASGALNGLLRLRSFNQDDGHIFCRSNQIQAELVDFCAMLFAVYAKFGFEQDNIKVKISLRPKQRAGDESDWDKAEHALQQGLNQLNIPFELLPDEGAFYGPKVEFSLQDSLGRAWQCGTFQLDFILGKRMNAHFINEHGEQEHPVILHRAVLGSLERFIAILIEHYQGKLPLWLNPNAISIMPVGKQHIEYASQVAKQLQGLGIKVAVNQTDDSVSFKLRQHFKQKGHYCVIVGDEEQNKQIVTVRQKKSNQQMAVNEFIDLLKAA